MNYHLSKAGRTPDAKAAECLKRTLDFSSRKLEILPIRFRETDRWTVEMQEGSRTRIATQLNDQHSLTYHKP